ncbi:MAG: hypothetical protein ACXVLF_16225, partial [Flavisolibacter sp.]
MLKSIASLLLMGLFTALLSLFSCGQKKQSNSKVSIVDTGSVPAYPKDHKLTAEERKEYSDR